MSIGGLSKGMIVIALFGVFTAPNLNAQFLSSYSIADYQTLEWLFDTGQIDSDEFDQWSEFFTDSIQEISADSLAVIAKEQSTTEAKRAGSPSTDARAYFRMYHRGCDSQPYRRVIRSSFSCKPGVYASLIAEKSVSEEIYLRSRRIGWADGSTRIEAGGVDPVWCGGLVTGRHPIILSDKDPAISMLYSQRDRFNGILLESNLQNFSVCAVSSFDRDRLFTAAVNGGRIRYSVDGRSIEIAAIDGRVARREDGSSAKVSVIGTGVEAEIGDVDIRLDLAVDRTENSAYIARISNSRNRHRLDIWHYDADFLNPFGAGRANTDTREIRIDDIGLSYRSRYAGETGVQTRSEFPISISRNLIVESNWWRTGECDKYRLRGAYTHAVASTSNLRFMLLAGDDSVRIDGYGIWSVVVSSATEVSSRHKLIFRTRVKSGRTGARRKELYLIDGRWSVNSRFHSSHLMIRWFDPDLKTKRNHYLLCSLRESFNLGDGLRLSLVVSTRFGPDQRSIDQTRVTFESDWRL